MVLPVCAFSTGKTWKQAEPWNSGQPAQPTWWVPGHWQTLSQNNTVEEGHLRLCSGLWMCTTTYMNTRMCMCAHMHTHTQADSHWEPPHDDICKMGPLRGLLNVLRVGPFCWVYCSSRKSHWGACSHSLCERTQQEDKDLKPLTRTSHTSTSVSDSPPLRARTVIICCFWTPICKVLSWWLEQGKTGGYSKRLQSLEIT